MALKEQLQEDMRQAMRAGEAERRDVMRMLLAAVKQTEVDEQTTLDDEGVTAVLQKQAKQRHEAIADSERANRPDLAAQERAELAIIEEYLPQMMTREEIEAAARQTIADVGATDVKGMGQVMGALMPRLRGRADGRLVSEVVRDLLQNKA